LIDGEAGQVLLFSQKALHLFLMASQNTVGWTLSLSYSYSSIYISIA